VPLDALTARHAPGRLDGKIVGSCRQVEQEAAMKKLIETAVFLMALAFFSGNALATDDIFNTGQATLTEGSNTIIVDNNVKFINYVLNDVVRVTLDYNTTTNCPVAITGVTLRSKPFTPKGVVGNINNVTGLPALGTPATSGSVSFDLQFTALKKAGKSKNFGMAHLNLALNADENCDGSVDAPVNVGVQVSASTADHP
jgi:hypothetical protein